MKEKSQMKSQEKSHFNITNVTLPEIKQNIKTF